MSGDVVYCVDFIVCVQYQCGIIVYQIGVQCCCIGGDQCIFIDGGVVVVVVVVREDQCVCVFFGQ